ncbi:MAG: methenyltetrahydromethanopterin cyclohydrolase [Nitrososphaeria archaeon]|nr:methenyltetrahydromethanopterin cyclohydrolase [Nitrososphaeria archaeon]NIN51611.1 methenyltetrahydromethanopterin cyclohydrolase [Nitrososphaeria archaeon]NIQ32096.1 methenyltetrahydromethanopterin cyclohydrolase [Nitrososphaeria archaeon]
MAISVNKKAYKLVQRAIEESDELAIEVEKHPSGATILDAGIQAPGGYAAGRLLTLICLGGLGDASVASMSYGDITLPTIHVETDYPAIATLGAQFAGWRIKAGKYFAMGSGPARALSLRPKELYEKIEYRDEADQAVIVLETDASPTSEALEYMSDKCGVETKNLYVVVAPSSSLTGSVQISGRIVETGIHKLTELGFDPKRILYGYGYAPIAPVHPKAAKAMGRTNDALYYGGAAYLSVDYENDEELSELVAKAPSSTAREYGKPFYNILKDADFDFYKIDPNLFAPALVSVNNIKTGSTYEAGSINVEVLNKTMGIKSV